MEKKLYRDEYHKKLAGVCAGLAEYFGVDVTVVRLVFVLTCIFHGGGGLVYIILWIVLPKKPYPYFNPTVDYTVPPQNPDVQGTNTPGNAPFSNNPFPNQPFANQPFPNQPMQQHHGTSLAAIIVGVVLILIGGSFLLDNLDIIPDWDFGKLWPVILIVVGCVIMLSGETKKSFPMMDTSQNSGNKKESAAENTPPADNPPAV
jgi:phage shock protein PspC (stress-responsive transcriptional regulator)